MHTSHKGLCLRERWFYLQINKLLTKWIWFWSAVTIDMQRVTVNFHEFFYFVSKYLIGLKRCTQKLNFKDQYHFTSSGILNVQHLFQCRDDWYQWGGSGDSGLAPGPPQRVTWNEGVHQSITHCCRARCVKSVIDLKLVIIPSVSQCASCALCCTSKTEVVSRNSSYWYMYSCVL